MSRKIDSLIIIIIILIFYGCAEIIEKSLTNQTIELSAPADNVVSADTLQTLYWQLTDGANNYELQIVSPRFDSIVKFIADTTIQTNIFPILMESGQYQWRVRGFNESSTTPYSIQRTLSIQ